MSKIKVDLELDNDVWEALENYSKESGKSIDETIEEIIKLGLEDERTKTNTK